MANTSMPRLYGWFRELDHGEPDGTSLRASLRDEPHEHREQIANYLLNGWVAADVVDSETHDLLDPANPVIGPYFILTDGVWAWPSDLAYFFLKYNAALPEEFIAHMQANGWNAPDVSQDQAASIGRAVLNATPLGEE